jgi:hypothetical protein
MPLMDWFELCEEILKLDINVRVCFISAGEINEQALREITSLKSVGCFIRKSITVDHLVQRIRKN